jgi:NADH-quinone oxidoreductase subunit A
VLRSYLPAIVFVVLGAGVGGLFVVLNSLVGTRVRPREKTRSDPYECGLPSEFRAGGRFFVSFYLIGLLFLIFDLEVVLLLPVSVALEAYGWHAVGAAGIFIGLLGLAFLYEWRRGALEWREH